jgi:hypothetical protein
MNPYRPSNPSESEASPHQTMNVETENQEKPVPDPRVVAALDDLGYEYDIKADGTHFHVRFNMDEGRSQCVFISSATNEFMGVELRGISSIGLVSEGLFDARTANFLLRENAGTNLGYWCIEMGEENSHYALFCMRVSAVLSHRALGEILVMVAKIADQAEKRFSGLDDF